MEAIKSKEQFWQVLHELRRCCYSINFNAPLKYVNAQFQKGEDSEVVKVHEIDWCKYAPEIYDYIHFAKRKSEHYPNSIEYKQIYETLVKVKASTDFDSINNLFEDLFYRYENYEEDKRRLELKWLNDMRKNRRVNKRRGKNFKIKICIEAYQSNKLLYEEAMEILKIKDKRTFLKYIKLVNEKKI